MRRIWIGLILFYQRWISPYKGFRCAHGKLHKGFTCSEAVKRIIEEDGLWRGRHRIRRRFRECRYAHYVLRSRPLLVAQSSGDPWLMVGPDSDKPPVRPEYGGAVSDAQPTSPTKGQSGESSDDKPKKYFKRGRADDCADCLCFPAVVPCDADCAGIDCDVCPCDLPF